MSDPWSRVPLTGPRGIQSLVRSLSAIESSGFSGLQDTSDLTAHLSLGRRRNRESMSSSSGAPRPLVRSPPSRVRSIVVSPELSALDLLDGAPSPAPARTGPRSVEDVFMAQVENADIGMLYRAIKRNAGAKKKVAPAAEPSVRARLASSQSLLTLPQLAQPPETEAAMLASPMALRRAQGLCNEKPSMGRSESSPKMAPHSRAQKVSKPILHDEISQLRAANAAASTPPQPVLSDREVKCAQTKLKEMQAALGARIQASNSRSNGNLGVASGHSLLASMKDSLPLDFLAKHSADPRT